MVDSPSIVFIVDDDASMRRALSRLIANWGYETHSFPDAKSFLEAPNPDRAACAILDLRMPSLGGLELQRALVERGQVLPTVFLTGHGDIRASVEAIRGGAIDFLEKPVDAAVLRTAVCRALDVATAARRDACELENMRRRLADLTPREREALGCVLSGAPNKAIARRLGITERTVKAHRRRVMEKMQAGSVAELARLAERLGVEPDAG